MHPSATCGVVSRNDRRGFEKRLKQMIQESSRTEGADRDEVVEEVLTDLKVPLHSWETARTCVHELNMLFSVFEEFVLSEEAPEEGNSTCSGSQTKDHANQEVVEEKLEFILGTVETLFDVMTCTNCLPVAFSQHPQTKALIAEFDKREPVNVVMENIKSGSLENGGGSFTFALDDTRSIIILCQEKGVFQAPDGSILYKYEVRNQLSKRDVYTTYSLMVPTLPLCPQFFGEALTSSSATRPFSMPQMPGPWQETPQWYVPFQYQWPVLQLGSMKTVTGLPAPPLGPTASWAPLNPDGDQKQSLQAPDQHATTQQNHLASNLPRMFSPVLGSTTRMLPSMLQYPMPVFHPPPKQSTSDKSHLTTESSSQ